MNREIQPPFARWGMTASEIVASAGLTSRAVAGDEQKDCSGPGFTTLAVAEYRLGAFEFDVSFRAAEGQAQLAVVRLELRDEEQYAALEADLRARYGEAEALPEEPDKAIEGLRWKTPEGVAILKKMHWPMDLGTDVVVDYEPADGSH